VADGAEAEEDGGEERSGEVEEADEAAGSSTEELDDVGLAGALGVDKSGDRAGEETEAMLDWLEDEGDE
jgi:hypothetical protein